jgi:Integrase core domain
MAIEEVVTAPRSPWQNAYVERIIGSIRRECLDHIIIFDERHLRRMLSAYFQYHQHCRTHLSLCKDCPEPRPIQTPSTGTVIAFPQVGGLHHRYERRAAWTVCGDQTCTAVAVPGVVAVRNCVSRMQAQSAPMHGDRAHKSTSALFDKPQSSTMAFIGKPIPSPDGFLSRDSYHADEGRAVAQQSLGYLSIPKFWAGTI